MNELVFVGLGLNDECGITLRGLEEVKTAHTVFIETYTSRMPDFSFKRFEAMCGKTIEKISRRNLEEENGKKILEAAKVGKTIFLVPGDPFIATTHITLRIEAEKQGIKTRVIHGISIISAIISLSGLHNYKFGKTVTIPFPENFSETPYSVITQNKQYGLHTLCLLDLEATENKYLSIKEAIEILLELEEKKKKTIITANSVGIGIARAGSDNPTVKAEYIRNLINYNFGEPPYSLILPGEMHFMEVNSMIALSGAPTDFRRLST